MLLKLWLVRIAVALVLVFQTNGVSLAANGNPLQGRIYNHYSPYNKKRPVRPYTRYIILHTTEGEDKGSLRVVTRSGLAHYFVSTTGRVYRIIHKSKIAKHAGRSMWDGTTTIDNYSIGIEVSGYHDRDITDAQYEVLRELIRQLQSLYDIPDEDVIPHSMVAYGRPNHFHRYNYRGRRRCGMLFGKPEVRARLGLEAAPASDPDVDAGRLKVADKHLFRVLFSDKPKTSVAAASVASTEIDASAAATIPDTASAAAAAKPITAESVSLIPSAVAATTETAPATEITTAALQESDSLEAQSRSFIIDKKRTAWEIARERYNHSSTVYIFPNGKKKTGDQITDWAHMPVNTRVILEGEDTEQFEGFLEIGRDGDTAEEVAGTASASSTTIYFFPDGFIRTGAELKRRRSYQKLLNDPPEGTKVLIGYVYGGRVKGRRPPSSIAGVKWNYPSTFYRYPDGKILNGDNINDKEIPPNTLVFFQQ